MQQVESFYCKAYETSDQDKKTFCGRSLNYVYEEASVKERGLQRPRFQSFEAGWWSRVANTLHLYCTLTSNQVKARNILDQHCCRPPLAISGVSATTWNGRCPGGELGASLAPPPGGAPRRRAGPLHLWAAHLRPLLN